VVCRVLNHAERSEPPAPDQVPLLCPPACAASVIPWWGSCGESPAGRQLDAVVGGELSAFYLTCATGMMAECGGGSPGGGGQGGGH
jgi:hypothetical protein